MERLSMRELSRETAAVLDRVERGESVEVKRGSQVVARVIPVRAVRERVAQWRAHVRWFEANRSHGRRELDPVDELLAMRQPPRHE